MRKGFTLIEIIITIAIISLIAAAVFVSVNPGQRLGDTKDSLRKSNVVAIEKAIQKTIAEELSIPSALAALTENTPYMIVTEGSATTGTCNCNTSDEAIARIDLAGDFEVYLAGSMPVDEDATGDDTGYYIKRVGNSFFINHCNAYGDTYVFSCESTLTDARDSKTYDIVQIGYTCWMAEHLNVGIRVAGATVPTDNGTIEKHCYDDNESNCTSDGALYTWSEAIQYVAPCNGTGEGQPACASPVQGICPSGWHMPSHYEYTALTRGVCTSGTCATDFPYDESTTGWRGSDEGTKLKVGGSSGFNGILAGYSNAAGVYVDRNSRGYLMSSSESSANYEWTRRLNSTLASTYIYVDWKVHSISLRCIQD